MQLRDPTTRKPDTLNQKSAGRDLPLRNRSNLEPFERLENPKLEAPNKLLTDPSLGTLSRPLQAQSSNLQIKSAQVLASHILLGIWGLHSNIHVAHCPTRFGGQNNWGYLDLYPRTRRPRVFWAMLTCSQALNPKSLAIQTLKTS